jgi:hypothetical protein
VDVIPRRGGGRRTSRRPRNISTQGRPAPIVLVVVLWWLWFRSEWMDGRSGTGSMEGHIAAFTRTIRVGDTAFFFFFWCPYLGRGDAPGEEGLAHVLQRVSGGVEPQRQHADLKVLKGSCDEEALSNGARGGFVVLLGSTGGQEGWPLDLDPTTVCHLWLRNVTHRGALPGGGRLDLLAGVEHLAQGHLHVRLCVCMNGSGRPSQTSQLSRWNVYVCVWIVCGSYPTFGGRRRSRLNG